MENTERKDKIWPPVLASLIESRSFLLISVFVPVLIILLDQAGIFSWQCPFYAASGLYCPGCGMTRAGVSLIQGDFSTAFSHHPFCLIFGLGWFFFLIMLFLPKSKISSISLKIAAIEKKFPVIPVLFILFLFFGLARLIFQIYD